MEKVQQTRSGFLDPKAYMVIRASHDSVKAEFAHALLQEMERASASYGSAALNIGEGLMIVKDLELYRTLGYNTFREFVAASGLNISIRTAQLLIRAARFVLALDSFEEFAGIPYNKADVSKLVKVIGPVRKAMKDKNIGEAKEWLIRALPVAHGGLSRSDLDAALVQHGFSEPRPQLYFLAKPVGSRKYEGTFVKARSYEDVMGKAPICARVHIVAGRDTIQYEQAPESSVRAEQYEQAQEASVESGSA